MKNSTRKKLNVLGLIISVIGIIFFSIKWHIYQDAVNWTLYRFVSHECFYAIIISALIWITGLFIFHFNAYHTINNKTYYVRKYQNYIIESISSGFYGGLLYGIIGSSIYYSFLENQYKAEGVVFTVAILVLLFGMLVISRINSEKEKIINN